MSRAAARATTAPRRSVKPKRRAQPRAKKPGVLDHFVAALPFTEATLRKIAAWSILGIACAVLLAIATWFGVPGMIGVAVAEGIGRAGLRVEQVEVTGLNRADRISVYQKALDQQSRAMPLVDLDQVRERLMTDGWIADARVSRRLPDTLVIEIKERQPAAVWQYQGQLMLIDGKGVLLEAVSPDSMPQLPLVIGDGANQQEPAYQRLLDAAPALKPMVRAATWIGNRRWDLLFVGGERLSLPEGEAEAARALMKFAELDGTRRLLGRGYLRFDMRDPTRMVLRLPDRVVRETIKPTAEAL